MGANPHPSRVVAVVPIFDPPWAAVPNVLRLSRQAAVVLVNDGSPDTAPLRALVGIEGTQWIHLQRNTGIAAALNAGVAAALDMDAEYVLTLDQDSTISDGFVAGLAAVLDRHPAASTVVAPGSLGDGGRTRASDDAPASVPEVLQSGMMFKVATYLSTGPFDETLFIDGVDTDYCLRLRSRGGVVLAVPDVSMVHQLGAGDAARTFRIGPWRPVATGHSSIRRYYMTRNRLVLLQRYGAREPAWAAVTIRRTIVSHVLALLLEGDRESHFKMIARGVRDFARRRLGKLKEGA